MTVGKAIRLSKVARELNVGTSTIIEFLSSKGFEVSSNPNTKVEPEMYQLLLEKFQPDMLIKQKKEQALVQAEKDRAELFGKDISGNQKSEKKFIKEDGTPDEEIVVKSNVASKDKEAKQEQVKPAETTEPEKPAEPKAETKPEETKAEAPKEVAQETKAQKEPAEPKEEPKVEKPTAEVETKPEPEVQKPETPENKPSETVEAQKETKPEAPKEEPKAEEPKPTEEPADDKKHGLKVLGKIDLEQKAKKPHKEEPKAQEKPKQEEKSAHKAEPAKTEQEAEKATKPVETEATAKEVKEEKTKEAEKPKESTKQAEATDKEADNEAPAQDKPVDHKWQDKREELKGLTVLGKIDVKQFEPKKKKPDEKADEKKKRKRKRITASKAVSSTDDREKLLKASRDSQDKKQGGGGAGNQQGGAQGNRPPRGQNQGGPGQRPNQGGGNNNRNNNNNNRRRGARDEKQPVDDKAIQNQIKETLSRLTSKDAKGNKTKLKKRKKEILRQRAEEQELEQQRSAKILEVTEFITANEFANLMNVSVTEVIMACMSLGMMVSINQRIDAETISLVADEFGYEVKFKEVEMDEPSLEEADDENRLEDRPPIVTIMGHVDHGKTSLLDFIRKANVIAGEAGGITQHIGAYEVELENGKKITFLDTPGHEAFTAMRARGAKVTDIVIIVVAADDRVMPQTKEAIAHAQAAGVPMIFAINKIDREAANPDFIKQQLADENILIEEWGGKYQSQEISAKTGLNVDQLLEKVLLEAEMLELKADAGKRAVGTIIEATLDRGRGIVSTVLVQSGTMRVGDNILAGAHYGKVKAMFNERGKRVNEAGPSTPVQVLGFDGAPSSGDRIYATKTEQEAKQIAIDRTQLIREQGIRATKHITLDEIGRRIAVGSFKELKIIVKGDVDGSVEALSDSLLKLSTEEIQVSVIHKGVGQISESDVLLASASDAVIIGFQVRPSVNARNLAEKEQIEIRLYSVIYDAIDELKAAMEGMLEPTTEEKIVANVEVRETFRISKVGTIAGCMVTSGKVNRNHKVRIIRDGVVRFTGEIATLKRFKDDVKEVATGYECGIQIANFNDIQIGDIIEAYELVEVKRKL
ncbi:translation initiation factor IF-2 [bacterium]|nr:translation initiation factor IF-2 [bacterium]